MRETDPARAAEPPTPANVANELDLLLLGAADVDLLCAGLLRFLLQRAGVDGVWLGQPGADGRFGFDAVGGDGMQEFLDAVGLRQDGDPLDAAVLAWQSGSPQIVADWARDPRSAPSRAAGEVAGWSCAVFLPLQGGAGRRDVLALYSRQRGFFQQIRNQRLVWHLHAVLGLQLGRLHLLREARRQLPVLQLYRGALETTDLGVMLCDMRVADAPLVYVNPAFTRLTGYASEQALGRNCRFLQGPQLEEGVQPQLQTLREALREGRACCVELRNLRADGSVFWNELTLSPLRDAGGTLTHYLGLARDVSLRHQQQAEHESTQGLYRALLAEEELVLNATDLGEMLQQACERLTASGPFSGALVGRAGRDGDIDVLAQAGSAQVNESWYRPNVAGEQAARSLAGRVWVAQQTQFSNDYLNDPDDFAYREQARARGVRAVAFAPVRRGDNRWALLGVVSGQPGVFTPAVLELLERVARLIGHGLDAFDLQRRLQQEHRHIAWLAEHDPLTGLLNRRGLTLRLEEAVAQVDAQGGFVAVGILDFDGFKQINDNYGHAAGDALLRAVASRLVEAVRSSDTVARLGGDEIVLVLQGMVARSDLEPMLERIRKAVDASVALPGDEAAVNVRASLGLTVYPEDGSNDPEELLRHADQALYAIKQSPREGSAAVFWRVYQPDVDRDHFSHLKLVRDRFAGGGLRVFYQPVVDMLSGRVVEVEALSRLDDGRGRLIPPPDFIHLLGRDAQAGLVAAVLRHAVNDAQRWQRECGVEMAVAVNIDPMLLASGEALAVVREVVGELGFPPKRIVLEILEHADFLSFNSARDALHELREFGCRIALDDIGSAYSSLLRVKELPIDIIKLDQAFIRGLTDRPQDLRFVQSLTQLARGLGVEFVAEGAETDDIVEALRALRVPLAQGYGIARPMSADAFGVWLRERGPMHAPENPGLLTCVAEQVVRLDMDLLIARHYPDPKPALTMDADPAATPLGQWLRRAGLTEESPLVQACAELQAMFRDWMHAGPQADDSMVQSALDHLLRSAGEHLREAG